MGFSVLVVGDSGTGKSRAIKNLDPKTTVIVSPNNKQLPFQGAAANYKEDINMFRENTFSGVLSTIKQINTDPAAAYVKTLILEDLTHYFSKRVMDEANQEGYGKWGKLAVDTFKAIIATENDLRSDLNMIIIAHVEANVDSYGNSVITLQTPGKLLDKQIKIPSYFTYILHTAVTVDQGKPTYQFLTNTDGIRLAKSPEGCFPQYIENDYQYVLNRIAEYQNTAAN